jgi:hypothetical protein
MSLTEEEIFNRDGIIQASVLVSEHQFKLSAIDSTIIHVRTYKNFLTSLDVSRYTAETSHLIKTPLVGLYTPNVLFHNDPQHALNRAVHGIVSYYESAVSNGHSPSDDWLVPNTSFYR